MSDLSEQETASLFGTDGIRDRAGEGLLAPLHIESIVAATAYVLESGAGFTETPADAARTVLVARDTRRSGKAIFRVLAESFGRYGYLVKELGILPTPAVSYLAGQWDGIALGVVLSASHNPAEYNGIKFFSHTGEKVSVAFEDAVSQAFWTRRAPAERTPVEPETDALKAFDAYVKHLASRARRPQRLRGRSVALDTANGATYQVAPAVFRTLGMEVLTVGNDPDGENINAGCGALFPQGLAELVREKNLAFGFCFDGDGDRMIAVGREGLILDGDHVLLLTARRLARSNALPERTVVATVMSNYGLEKALEESGLKLVRTAVGDRNVYAEMVCGQHPVGGEQSGHTIFLDDAKTGDGVLSALRLLDSLESDSLDVAAEAGAMRRFPQVLKNVRVEEKIPFEQVPAVEEAVAEAEAALAGSGRVVLRYSGTEPLARVMVEAADARLTEKLADDICEAIRAHMA